MNRLTRLLLVVDGSTENSASGVYTYITVATGAIMAAAVVATVLVRQQCDPARPSVEEKTCG